MEVKAEVKVGQVRRDPDPRMNNRRVQIVDLEGERCRVKALDGPVGRHSRIRVDRIAKWELVATVVDP